MINQRGTVFMTTMIATLLMSMIGGYIFRLTVQDSYYIGRLKNEARAQFLAEAGLATASATLASSFSNKDNPANFPLTNLDGGTFDVNVVQSNGRVLLRSVGTFSGAQRVATLEIEDLTPTALNYAQAGGGSIYLHTVLLSNTVVNGDLFANQNVDLLGLIAAPVDINGDVYAGGTITRVGQVTWDSATPNAGNVTFPVYDFNYYKTIAQANGRYYSSSQTWTNQTFNLNNAGGVIFVDGDVTFWGTNNITGALVSTGTITLYGRLNQSKAANYPSYPALMTYDDDIRLLNFGLFQRGILSANGLVYSGRDFGLLGIWSSASVTGSVLAKGTLRQLDIITTLDITYQHQSPPGLIMPGGNGSPTRIKSYNQ